MDIRIKDNNTKALITTVVNSSMQASKLADMFSMLPYCECDQRTYNEETNTAEIYLHIKKKLFNNMICCIWDNVEYVDTWTLTNFPCNIVPSYTPDYLNPTLIEKKRLEELIRATNVASTIRPRITNQLWF